MSQRGAIGARPQNDIRSKNTNSSPADRVSIQSTPVPPSSTVGIHQGVDCTDKLAAYTENKSNYDLATLYILTLHWGIETIMVMRIPTTGTSTNVITMCNVVYQYV